MSETVMVAITAGMAGFVLGCVAVVVLACLVSSKLERKDGREEGR